MQRFKLFLAESENEYKKDIEETLKKLPKKHADLVKDYKFKFQNGNTLKNDNGHIGLVDPKTRTIIVASPWNYGRQYTLLHEIAHMVYDTFVNTKMRETWQKIVNNTKEKQNQNAEELFCMAYANYYAKNKIVIHTHSEWDKFIKNLPH